VYGKREKKKKETSAKEDEKKKQGEGHANKELTYVAVSRKRPILETVFCIRKG